MNSLAFALIMLSTLTHAYWNYLSKTVKYKELFFWTTKLAELMIYAIPFFILLRYYPMKLSYIKYMVPSAFFGACYCIFLAKAYSKGDLSIVYPIARSSMLFVPFISFFFIGEMVSFLGLAGILTITIGIIFLNAEKGKTILKSFNSWAVIYAIAVAFFSAIYSVIDKAGVTVVNPMIYIYMVEFFMFSFLTMYLLYVSDFKTMIKRSKGTWKQSFIAGFFMTFTYVLVLFAFQLDKVSYGVAVRQFSIVIGVLIGALILKEKDGRHRFIASIIIMAGIVLVGLAS